VAPWRRVQASVLLLLSLLMLRPLLSLLMLWLLIWLLLLSLLMLW